jgi:hypothetical protein
MYFSAARSLVLLPENSRQGLMRICGVKVRNTQNLHSLFGWTIKGFDCGFSCLRASRVRTRKILFHEVPEPILEVHTFRLRGAQTVQISARESKPHHASDRLEHGYISRFEAHHEAARNAHAFLDEITSLEGREFIRADAKPHT